MPPTGWPSKSAIPSERRILMAGTGLECLKTMLEGAIGNGRPIGLVLVDTISFVASPRRASQRSPAGG